MVVSKDLLNGVVTPLGLNGLRFIAGLAFFWIFSIFKSEKVAFKDLLMLMAGAVFGLMANQVLFIKGLSMTTSIDASIISTTVPIMTMLLSALILKEPISWLKAIGVAVGATGAVFLVFSAGKGETAMQGDIAGNLLCFASAFSFSLFLVMTKPVIQKYSAITVMKWMFLFATIMALPFSYKDMMATDFSSISSENTLRLIFVLFFATVLPYLLIPVGQKTLRPTTQSMYNYVQPIVAVTLAIIAGTNDFTVTKMLASGLVFLGVYIVTRSKSRADIEAEKAKKAS